MMKGRMLICLLMLAVSCSRPLPVEVGGDMGYLTFTPVFGHSVEVDTKGAFGTIDGVNFQFNGSIFVYNAGTDVPHVLGYDNMMAQVDARWDPNTSRFGFSWLFFPNGISTDGLDVIGIMKGAPVDVYAYVPYVAGMTDLTSVPFRTAEQNDIMYASKENIQVTGMSNELLHFQHAMACITLQVKTVFSNNIYISYVYVNNAEADGKYIAKSGTVNGKTGELSNLQFDDSRIVVPISPNRQLTSGKVTEFSILVPPVADYDDPSGIEICFKSRQNTETEHFYLPLPPEVDGRHPFEKGKEYIYEVTLDDFVMVSPVIKVVGYDTEPDKVELQF